MVWKKNKTKNAGILGFLAVQINIYLSIFLILFKPSISNVCIIIALSMSPHTPGTLRAHDCTVGGRTGQQIFISVFRLYIQV